jgi:hypothetical protein
MPGTWMKRQEKTKPTFVALTCDQLQLLRAFTQAQYNVTDISTCNHRGISNRLPLRNRICQTAGEGETSRRGFNMWPVKLLRALKQTQYNVWHSYMEFRTDCNFVTEYARNMNEKAGEGETNPRDSYMWTVDCVICPRRYSQGKVSLCVETRLSIRDSVSATTLFLGFSWNSVQEFFTEICWAWMSFLRIGAVTAILYLLYFIQLL